MIGWRLMTLCSYVTNGIELTVSNDCRFLNQYSIYIVISVLLYNIQVIYYNNYMS